MNSIRTQYVYPPIPWRGHDWCAWEEGSEESGPYGWGESKEKAIAQLIDVLGYSTPCTCGTGYDPDCPHHAIVVTEGEDLCD